MKSRARKRPALMKTAPAAEPPARTQGRSRLIALGIVVIVVVAAAVGLFRYRRPPAGRTVAGSGLNVLLITADTTRADFLGCYGRPNGRTPNMDRLASEGAIFQRCITAAPMTEPSHASIFTADYPYVHGSRRNGDGRLAPANTTLTEVLKQAGYRTQATIASFVLNHQFGFAQGFDVYHDLAGASSEESRQAERKANEVSDDAIALLREKAAEPFFFWVHYYDPHVPYETQRPPPYTLAEAYEDEVAFMDEQIGRLLAEVHALGLDGRTLVVLVGDHGEGLMEHGESQHGYFLYETTLHVPLVMRCPGKIAPGTSIADVVRTIDVAPTILALLELPSMPNVQGLSLTPWLQGKGGGAGLRAYAETLEPYAQFGLARLRSLTQGDWKYILAPTPELYRPSEDPAEAHSLAAAQPDVGAAMREQLRLLVAESPPAVRSDEDAGQLSDSDRARLESLGYVGTGVRRDEADKTELERFEPADGNPMDYAEQFELTVQAREAMQKRDYAGAAEMFQRVLAALQGAPHVHAALGMALASLGRLSEALPEMERALSVAKDDTNIRSSYGSLLIQAGRFQDAADQFRVVLRENPQNTRNLHNMAIALTQLNRLDEADQHLQMALNVEPRNPRLLHTLGVLRSRQNRFAEAEQYLVKALAIDPAFRQCQDDLNRLRQATGSPKP